LAGPERFHKKEGWVALLLPQQYPCLYNAAKSLLLWQDIPERAHVKHVFVKTAARVNNRAENSASRPAGANARCAAFAMRVARRRFFHTLADPAALRVAQTSNERGMSSCCTQRTLRHMAWLDYYWRSRENYLIRITTLELHR
jgi:hypothetical protein